MFELYEKLRKEGRHVWSQLCTHCKKHTPHVPGGYLNKCAVCDKHDEETYD